MAEEQPQQRAEEDPFAEDDEWLAAEVRQLFRARRAGDAKAVEVALFYFEHYLTLTLRRHLRLRDPAWDGSRRWLDGLDAEPGVLFYVPLEAPRHARVLADAEPEHYRLPAWRIIPPSMTKVLPVT